MRYRRSCKQHWCFALRLCWRKQKGDVAMADVMKIARDRVDALEAETARLREFLRMAEKLLKDGSLGGAKAPGGEDRRTGEADGAQAVKGPLGGARNGVTEEDDLALGEPATGQSMAPSFAKQVESALERKNLFRRPSP